VSRFCCYALAGMLALLSPALMGASGEAHASYCALSICGDQDLAAGCSDTSGSNAGAEAPVRPSEPEPAKLNFERGVDTPANNGAGSSTSSNNSFSPTGAPGVISEAPTIALPFVTRLRIAEERVTICACPSSVFEPPRAN
jgi:hypothetical protein